MTATDRPNVPNVIVFITDQQRWDTAGVHGNPARPGPPRLTAAAVGVTVAE